MRTLALLMVFFLVLAGPGLSAEGQPGHGDGPDWGPGAQPQSGQGDGNGTNETGGNETGAPGNASGQGPPAHANASEVARERARQKAAERGGDAQPAWQRSVEAAKHTPAFEARADALERLPDHAEANMGLFTPTVDGFEGRFVSFSPADDWVAIENVSVNGVVVFEAIAFPPDENVNVRHAGNAIHIRGEDWRFSLVDAPPAPITMRTDGESFEAVLPDGVLWDDAPFAGALVEYPLADGEAMHARLVGPDPRDPDIQRLLNIEDSLNFHVSAQRTVLSHVANKERTAIDEALTQRTVGGEITMLRDPGQSRNVLSDVVVFEDMDIQVSPGRAMGQIPDNATAHTISVSAHGIPGKTIVVNLEKHLVDPGDLHIRYYNELGNDTVQEVGIRMASSLSDVLDPGSGGLVPQYWIVEDIDGVQLLVTIPHFSTHHIELLSFDVDPVTVSLIAGALGAVGIVAVATVGLFRRPRDDDL